MIRFTLIGTAAILLFGTACQTVPKKAVVSEPANTPVAASHVDAVAQAADANYEAGKAMLRAGNYQAAMKQFAYLRDHAQTSEQRDRAVIGLSMALQDSGNRGAALGVLEPLPLMPRTELEAKKCIVAGEIHLKQKNEELAKDWFIRGLESQPGNQSPYRATAFFNLGKLLVSQDDLENARVAFFEAQEIFAANGDIVTAEQCQSIVADIDRALM